jgi:hypothetical protein
MCTDFGEFCVLISTLTTGKKIPGVEKAFEGIVRRSGLKRWMDARTPCADEVRGRWEVMMLERHIQTFMKSMMGAQYKLTPRSDERAPPPMFNADKVPARMKKTRSTQVDWALLEEHEEKPAAPVRRESKGLKSKGSSDRRPSKERLAGSKDGPRKTSKEGELERSPSRQAGGKSRSVAGGATSSNSKTGRQSLG